MCGIIGGITNEKFLSAPLLESISHRGPDSSGFFRFENVFLGHTRLSIQDLSTKANQPMYSLDKKFVIIFNGEIYNHVDLRNKYLKDFDFRTSGDTETILQLFVKYGESCLKLLNGIFSFSIFNFENKELFIARDHFGIKPLYIYKKDENFFFGSEIKSFLNFGIDKTLSYEAIENYLTFLWSPGDMTPFKYVKKLHPGNYIKCSIDDINTLQVNEYYSNFPNGNYSKFSEKDAIDELDKLLTNAVNRQLLSDVPVGFFLSGGLDSTLLVAIAKKLKPKNNFPCFTINANKNNEFKKEGFIDDLFFAKKAAKYLKVDLTIVESEIDIVNDFDTMIWHLDEPQADAAPLNVYNISKIAREKNIKVLIGGTAGDDLFSGYRRHLALKYDNYIEFIPLHLRRFIRFCFSFLFTKNVFLRRIKKLSENLDEKKDDRLIGYFKWMKSSKVKKLFNNKIKLNIFKYDSNSYFKNLLVKLKSEKSILNKILFLEQKTFLTDHNLNYTDKMSMAVGVETRVPYLDIDLVNFAQNLNPEFKLKNGETKYILKKVAERYLPKEIIYRPKTGFGAPVRKWITEDLTEMIDERLCKSKIIEQGIFDFEEIKDLISKNKSGQIDASYNIWSILAITSWINQFK